MNKILTSSTIRDLIIDYKPLYLFKNLCISSNNINMIAFDLYTLSENTPPPTCINLHFFRDEAALETFDRLANRIDQYIDIPNKFDRRKICIKILESALDIALMYYENLNLDHSDFEHLLTYKFCDGREIYTLKGLRYFIKFNGNGVSKYRYAHNLECNILTLIQKINAFLFSDSYCICNKDIYDSYSRKLSINKLEMERKNNMEIFISKKKKDGSLYLVDKCGNKSVSIKLPDELKKAFEKSASIKLKDEKKILFGNNKILLYITSGNIKEDRERCKSIILSWLPDIKYRKMLFTSFALLLIKIKFKHISIDKDIFERFKIIDTKSSHDKLYDIADLLIKIYFNKCKYKAMKEDFSLD